MFEVPLGLKKFASVGNCHLRLRGFLRRYKNTHQFVIAKRNNRRLAWFVAHAPHGVANTNLRTKAW
jgi:hypothetical protein